MKNIFLCLLLLGIVSCQSVGVIESSDPRTKINDGYRMLNDNRTIPALRLFNEANEIINQGSDELLKAQSFLALGDVYKFKGAGSSSEVTYSFQKAVDSYQAAALIFLKLKLNQKLSITFWGLAQTYAQEKNNEKTCEFINKAAKAYYDPSGSETDRAEPSVLSKVIAYFQDSKSKNFKTVCGSKP